MKPICLPKIGLPKLCVLIAFLLMLFGFQNMALSQEARGSNIELTDLLGRQVTLKQAAQRVVLTFNFEEYFAVMGESGISKIVGWSRQYWEGRRQSTWDVFTQKIPTLINVPDVGYAPKSTLSVEAILALNPDLVIMAANDANKISTELERLYDAHIPVIFVDFHSQTIANHSNSILLIGKAMGEEDRAQRLVEFYQTQMSVVTDRLAANVQNLAKPNVYMEFSIAEGPGAFGNTWGSLMWGAIIEQTGGHNIAIDLVKGVEGTLTAEQILASNPDIVIFTGNQFKNSTVNVGLGYTSDKALALRNLQSFTLRAGWGSLNAVKNQRVYALYHDLSRHIFDVAGFQFMAKVIHPELFQDLDPNETLRIFHEQFYPVDYTGVWMIELGELSDQQ